MGIGQPAIPVEPVDHGPRGVIRGLYKSAVTLATPAIALLLARRARRGKEDPARRQERWGIASTPRPPGRVVWAHGASVGESLSLQPIIADLLARHSDLSILVTTQTLTAARLMGERLPDRAVHQFVPVDTPRSVGRFLDHWRPDLVLWVESELWPTQLWTLADRGIPTVLLNARMSDRSYRRWRRYPKTIGGLLAAFSLVCGWDAAMGERFRSLGAATLGPSGNLKLLVDPPAANATRLSELTAAIGDRPCWLAASTHPGEEEIVLAAHRTISERLPDLVTVIAPRHPERGPAVAALASDAGLAVSLRSRGDLPGKSVSSVYIADTLGEMGTLLRAVPVVCIGGSLVPHGGHNPIEPALTETAMMFGPHTENFADLSGRLEQAGGAMRVEPEVLANSVHHLLTDADARAALVGAARTTIDRLRPDRRGLVDAIDAHLASGP